MTPSILVSKETERKLEAAKRNDETFDELLERLAAMEIDTGERGSFADDDVVEDMAQARDDLNESLE